jgi:hypothetical protein
MRLYLATFPFEIDSETGSSSHYSPTLQSLRRTVREVVEGHVENEEGSLQYCCKPLGEPVDGLVPIEIRVKIERIEAVKLTRGLFCSAVNNAGNAGFVRERVEMRPMILRFKVPGELFDA